MSAAGRFRAGARLGAFGRHRGGATAVEFALVAAPFFALVLFTLQAALTGLQSQALENFNQSSSRDIVVGATQGLNLTAAQYKTRLCASLPVLLSCSKLYVDVSAVQQFSKADISRPSLSYDASGNVSNSWAYNPGAPGDIVTVRMMYLALAVPTIIGSWANQANTVRMIYSVAVFKNEPYGS